MWRFIVTTFGFLFLAFYQLSGGADYSPAEGSRQALAAERALAADQKRTALAQSKPKEIAPTPVVTAATDIITGGDAMVTLASAQGNALPKPDVAALISPPVDLGKAQALTEVAAEEPQDDIREVTGNRVNLRRGPSTKFNPIAKLTRGTEVRVLSEENGWVKLRVRDTGRIGYMADFLLTASN